ncbi:MAG TPA: prolyl oligopeptidase family serine peptidase [Verrucomicrobiae bacterium]|nr:prolyl oligopeptidase family serine peptidase [Verrucomicrobiae bacterium]
MTRALALLLVVPLMAAAAEKPAAGSKQYPPKGIPIPPEVRSQLESGLAQLGREIDSLRSSLRTSPKKLELLPDVEIFHKAVQFTLADEMFHKPDEFAYAKDLLKLGMERAAQLARGKPEWTTATGLTVRGYVSKLDGSVQPYGLVVPKSYKAGALKKHRLDFWFHGRGDTLSEVAFLRGRLNAKLENEFAPDDAFVLHPYGRFMNAYKFAGEVDVFEALDHAKKNYPIDDDRLCARGFSMGGAAAWHIGAHHASLWAAVNPGAGFVDVWNYQGLETKEPKPPWYEKKMYALYDALDYGANFFNTTLVTYSGEDDKQKAAADLMAAAIAAEGMKMTHIIGPKTGHKYEPNAKIEVAKLVDAAATKGRDTRPKKVRLVTYSLRFNRMAWVTADAMEKHWEKATIDAELVGSGARLTTTNITALTVDLPAGTAVSIDGTPVKGGPVPLSFVKQAGRWTRATPAAAVFPPPKRHGLQGPIDDAFVEPFVLVAPTGSPTNTEVGEWAANELADAQRQWRLQMRGEPRVKKDRDVAPTDIADANLILFGDPQSNSLIARIADKLPIKWSSSSITAGAKTFPAKSHVPVLVFPNPLNPKRYVVLNSGFTFAEVGGQSNSQQTPKLPDWAIIDITVPRPNRLLKGIAAADFFDEQWRMPLGK